MLAIVAWLHRNASPKPSKFVPGDIESKRLRRGYSNLTKFSLCCLHGRRPTQLGRTDHPPLWRPERPGSIAGQAPEHGRALGWHGQDTGAVAPAADGLSAGKRCDFGSKGLRGAQAESDRAGR